MHPLQWSSSIHLSFPIYLTSNLFDPSNPLLADIIGAERCDDPRQIYCVIDQEFVDRQPDILERTKAYLSQRPLLGQLAAEPFALPFDASRQAVHGAQLAALHSHEHPIYAIVIGSRSTFDSVGECLLARGRHGRMVYLPTTTTAQQGIAATIYAAPQPLIIFAPYAFIVDDAVFATLTDCEWTAGLIAAVMYALADDAYLFELIEQTCTQLVKRDSAATQAMVYQSLHRQIERAKQHTPLRPTAQPTPNIGAWAITKIESLLLHRSCRGLAGALSIALDATYAYQTGLLQPLAWQRILRVLQAMDIPVYDTVLEQHLHDRSHANCVLTGLDEARVSGDGTLTITLPSDIGRTVTVHEVDEVTYIRSIATLRRWAFNN